MRQLENGAGSGAGIKPGMCRLTLDGDREAGDSLAGRLQQPFRPE